MNNTTVKSEIIRHIIEINNVINIVCFPIIYINTLCLLILSGSWLVKLFYNWITEHKKYKIALKTQIGQSCFKNLMNNFISNRIKDNFLIAICTCECIMVLSFLFYHNYTGINNSAYARQERQFKKSHIFLANTRFFHTLTVTSVRISNSITAITLYALFTFVRILTQHLVHQYNYYRSDLKLRSKLCGSISLIVFFFILGLIRVFMLFHYILILTVMSYEYFLIIHETKFLLRLLKQRLKDATSHDNLGMQVIRYYKVAYTDYKQGSTVLLVAFLLQIIGLSINLIHPVFLSIIIHWDEGMKSIFSIPMCMTHRFPTYALAYHLIISSLVELVMSVGFSLLTIPYLIVSLRYVFRLVKKISSNQRHASHNPIVRRLLENNQNA